MLRLTLAQMRRSTGRLVAGAVAIVVGTAFIAATLLGSALIRDTGYAAMTASIGDADVVVRGDLAPDDLTTVREAPGTALADGVLEVPADLAAGGRHDFALLRATPTPGLETVELTEGTFPGAPGEVAITAASAERLGVQLGDTLETTPQLAPAPAADGDVVVEDEPATSPLRLVGILEDPLALFAYASTGLVTAEQLTSWVSDAGGEPRLSQILAVAQDGTSPAELSAAIGAALPGASVQTGTEVAEEATRDITGTALVFTVLILAFAAIAMFVAAIVITNTFQVLVAQRTRTLALLRCIGATKGQIRRSVLLEALLLGTLAGAGGLALGVALAQGALWVLSAQNLGLPLPDAVHVTTTVVLAPILTGAVVTVLAALAPARAATRVAPLAALRPEAPPDPRGRSRGRLVLAVLALVAGGAALVGAVVLGTAPGVSPDTAIQGGLALGILGGVVSFAGIMIGAVFIVPGLVRAMGRLLTRLGGGSTVRLATANAVRNPRRTATTATALVIGVTLVTLMSTGAVSARASLDTLLDEQFPADVVVTSTAWEEDGAGPLTPAQIAAVTTTEGVVAVAGATSAALEIAAPDLSDPITFTEGVAVDPDEARQVLRDTRALDGLAPGTVALSPALAEGLGVGVGDDVVVRAADVAAGPAGTSSGNEEDAGTTLVVSAVIAPAELVLVPRTLAEIAPAAPTTTLFARLEAGGDHAATVTAIQDRLTEADASGSAPYVSGAAAERALFEQVIGTLLAIVVGLLGVAVVIALIGVANTLSLSVIERRRESALLRAMGLTRGQLRGMLAAEGVLLALVGAGVGVVLGLLYGWAGTAVILGQSGGLHLAVPWAHLGVVVVVAVLAGLAASVLPARSSVRTPPVAALAAE